MLPKLFPEIDKDCEIRIRKFSGEKDISNLGAVAYGTAMDIEISVPRRIGASGVVCRIKPDGQEDRDIPLTYCRSDNIFDVYAYSLDTKELCQREDCGIFYYTFLFLRGYNTLFTDTQNNVDFSVSEKEGQRFRLLVHKGDFKTPEQFGEGIIYQIFTDRFYKGQGEKALNIPIRDDAVYNSDWENGIPDFPQYNGEPIKNNMFFGGNLWGVAEKLGYLAELGVKYIYLCPIFKAYSNHKYDTGDYSQIDKMFGGEEAFDNLISAARQKGIGIILDGVFNHTGDNSLYFNRYKSYGEGGAYNDYSSPYIDWYKFRSYPDDYESWWGIEILPKLNHQNESCRKYFTGENGIIAKYTARGIAGWRLDVADELSNEFLEETRHTVKSNSDGQAIIIGEVWENAAEKVAYGHRRKYFLGGQLDSVMNYPLKNAIVSFCLYGDGEFLYNTMTEIYASYPRQVSDKLMNLLGTHDTERILTVLGQDIEDADAPNCELAHKRLSEHKRENGIRLLKIAAAIQYTSYGIPSLYYGDEVGLEGYGDPFCRMPFPWHDISNPYRTDILEYYKKLGSIRSCEPAFNGGSFYFIGHSDSSVIYVREREDSRIIVIANMGGDFLFEIPDGVAYRDMIEDTIYCGSIKVLEQSVYILKEIKSK